MPPKTHRKPPRQKKHITSRKTARSFLVSPPTLCSAVHQIEKAFTTVLTTLRKFHWGTDRYSHHKITDDLYTQIDGHSDRFVETLRGKLQGLPGTDPGTDPEKHRCRTIGRAIQTKLSLYDLSSPDISVALFEFREFLESLSDVFDEKDGDLLSIRDDMLADVSRSLYLLVMK